MKDNLVNPRKMARRSPSLYLRLLQKGTSEGMSPVMAGATSNSTGLNTPVHMLRAKKGHIGANIGEKQLINEK